MNDSPVFVRFDKSVLRDGVLAEHYFIVKRKAQETVGAIRLRLSSEIEIVRYAGHIGYNVDEAFRGQHYAAYACLALKPIALQHGFAELWITCNPDNWPSRRTCERIGAVFIEIVELSEENDMYLKKGERQKCRYRWQLV